MLEQHLQELLDREHESVEEKFKSELLALMRNCSAEILQRYQRMRSSATSNAAATQNEGGVSSDAQQVDAASGATEASSSADRLEAIFHQPPPPPDFVSQDDYSASSLPQQMNLDALTSSRDSTSNQFSATSLMLSRRAPKSSHTSFSEGAVGYNQRYQAYAYTSQHNTHQQRSIHALSSDEPSNRSQRIFRGSQNHPISNAVENEHQAARTPSYSLSNEALLTAPYGPSTSGYQGNVFLDEQTPRLSDMPITGPITWPFQPAQFNDAQFHQNEMYNPNFMPSTPQSNLDWSSGMPGNDSRSGPQFGDGNYNNDVELGLEFSQPKRRRR
jgi:hypothetical protein